MKVDVKKLDQNKRELSIEVAQDVVAKKFDQVYTQIAKEAKVPGFRPGKAPRDILEKNFSQVAHEEVLKSLIPEVYNQALEAQNLEAIDLPKISDVKLDRNSLAFTATVELKPQITINDYKGIKVGYRDIEVSEEQVKAKLDSIKESSKIENIDDRLAKGLGYPSLEALKKVLRAQIYIQKENEQRVKIEQEIIDHLIKKSVFDLPVSLVNRQLNDMVARAKVELGMRGAKKEDIESQEKRLNEQLKPESEQRVRIYLILEAIAKKVNIALDDKMPSKTMEFLLREASWQKGG